MTKIKTVIIYTLLIFLVAGLSGCHKTRSKRDLKTTIENSISQTFSSKGLTHIEMPDTTLCLISEKEMEGMKVFYVKGATTISARDKDQKVNLPTLFWYTIRVNNFNELEIMSGEHKVVFNEQYVKEVLKDCK